MKDDKPGIKEPTPFHRFVKAMRALIAVPKSEVDQRLAEEKAMRRTKRAQNAERT